MKPEELEARASNARRLLDDPLLKETLEIIEREVIEAFVACPTRDTEGMRILQAELRRARKMRDILIGVIEQGKLSVHNMRPDRTLVDRVVDARNSFMA